MSKDFLYNSRTEHLSLYAWYRIICCLGKIKVLMMAAFMFYGIFNELKLIFIVSMEFVKVISIMCVIGLALYYKFLTVIYGPYWWYMLGSISKELSKFTVRIRIFLCIHKYNNRNNLPLYNIHYSLFITAMPSMS